MTQAPAQSPPTAELARGYFSALMARDPDRMASYWHADGVEDLVPVGILRGPEGVRDFFAELFAAIPDSQAVLDRVTADEHGAVTQWRLSGTFSGAPFQGIRPTGSWVEVRGADCLEFEDGKIVRNTVYYDAMEFARGVGLLPARESRAERAMLAAFNGLTRLRGRLSH